MRSARHWATVLPLLMCRAINRVAAKFIPSFQKEKPPEGGFLSSYRGSGVEEGSQTVAGVLDLNGQEHNNEQQQERR